MNQPVFERLYVYDDEIADSALSGLFERLLAPDLTVQLKAEAATRSRDSMRR